jgi:hypothetical protein
VEPVWFSIVTIHPLGSVPPLGTGKMVNADLIRLLGRGPQSPLGPIGPPDWRHTAIVINYDDSDGWYDHAYSGVTNPSLSSADNLTNTTLSGQNRKLGTHTRPA